MNRRYIVVTPCRNEETNLPNLVQSIVAQTVRPALWVIVDDGRADKTGEIIGDAGEKYGWVKEFYSGEHKEFPRVHYAAVCNKGFEQAIRRYKNGFFMKIKRARDELC